MTERNLGRVRRVVTAPYDSFIKRLGERMAQDPVLGPTLTAEARTQAAREALEASEPTLQKLVALRQQLGIPRK